MRTKRTRGGGEYLLSMRSKARLVAFMRSMGPRLKTCTVFFDVVSLSLSSNHVRGGVIHSIFAYTCLDASFGPSLPPIFLM